MRNEISRLQQFHRKAKEYKAIIAVDREFPNTKNGEELREDLIKRYEELKELIMKANGGSVPVIDISGYQNVGIFENAFSLTSPVAAFHCANIAPEFIIKTIAYHSNKKIKSNLKAETRNAQKRLYVPERLIESFKKKNDEYNYEKLIKLLEEINFNSFGEKPYSICESIRAVLDHIPPLFEYVDFKHVVSNYAWGKTEKKYMINLLKFKDIADDVLHGQISAKPDMLEMNEVPPRRWLTILLKEAVSVDKKKIGKITIAKKDKKKKDIIVKLFEKKITWDNFAGYNGDCFLIKLHVDNFDSPKPDYVEAKIIAHWTDGGWETLHFKFEGQKLNEPFYIKEHTQTTNPINIYLSDRPSEGLRAKRPMPNLDRNTLELVVTTRSGYKNRIKIKPGWIT